MIQEIIDEIIKKTDAHLMLTAHPKVKCVFLNTDLENKASQTYIKNKSKVLENYEIVSETINFKMEGSKLKDLHRVLKKIQELNNDESVAGIVVQLPVHKSLQEFTDRILNSVDVNKDVDGLTIEKFGSDKKEDLPITSEVLYDILEECVKRGNLKNPKIYLRGMGRTTNGRLFTYLLRKYGHIRVCNSKTDAHEDVLNAQWADIIISATGVCESVRIFGKIIISPTIAKSEKGWVNDLGFECREHNDTHKVLGTIGKLTCLYLAKRCYPSI